MKPAHGPSDRRQHRTNPRHAGDASFAPHRPAPRQSRIEDASLFEEGLIAASLTDRNSADNTETVAPPRQRRHYFRRGASVPTKAASARPKGRRSRRSRHADASGGPAGTAGKTARRPLWVFLKRVSFCLAGVAIFECGLALLTSPKFAVQDVEFPDNDFIPATTIAAVQDSLIGQNWIRVRSGQAERELKNVPEVRSAQVTRLWSWPPTVAVRIQQRRPFARVGGGDEWYVVDRDGVPFRAATAEDSDLYAVTGPLFNPAPGRAIAPEQWAPVVEFASSLSRDEENGQRWSLRRVYFDRRGFASLRLTGGQNDETLVQLGDGDWPHKLQKARWALADFAQTGKHAATLNLISSDVTTWTPRALPTDIRETVKNSGAATENATSDNTRPAETSPEFSRESTAEENTAVETRDG